MFLLPGGIFLSSLPPLPTITSFPFFPLSLPSPSSQAGTSGDKRLQTKLEQTDAAVVGTPQRGLQASGDGSPEPGCVVGPDYNSVYISSAPLFYLPSFTLWPNSSSRELVFVCLSSLPVFCNPPRADLLDRLAHACASGHVSGDLHMNSQRSKGMCAHIFIPARGFPAPHICLR